MKFSICLLALTALMSGTPSSGQEIQIDSGLEQTRIIPGSSLTGMAAARPRIALALSGGGARGFSQIGVLKILERFGIPVDGIAGTSIGAVVGGLYAAGYTAAELETLAVNISWAEIISNDPSRDQLFLNQKNETSNHLLQLRFKGYRLAMSSGYSSGHNFSALIRELLLTSPHQFTTDFSQLPIPFCAVTADLVSGRSVPLTSGSLTDALRASMAIPLLFTPLRKDSMLLVDGGLIQNLPVNEARSLGADIVICVDASSKLRDAADLNAPWKIADQVTTIMQQEKLGSQLRAADVAISPLLDNISNTDFDHIQDIIRAGEEAALAALPEIEAALTAADTAPKTLFRADTVLFSGFSLTDPFDSVQPFPARSGDTLISADRIMWLAGNLNQSGRYRQISVFLDTVRHVLRFDVEEQPRINSFHFFGNSVFQDSLIRRTLGMDTGAVLNVNTFAQSAARLIRLYKDKGYGLARVDSVWLNGSALYMQIDEGKISKIAIKGNRSSRPYVIRREVSQKAGDIFRTHAALESVENIYSTGFFDETGIFFPDKTNARTLTFTVHERERQILQMGTKYSLERRMSGFVRLIRDNILGFGAQGSLMGIAGRRDLSAMGRLWSNRLFYSLISYDIRLSLSRREDSFYRNLEYQGDYALYNREFRLTLMQQMKRLGGLSAQLAWQSLDVSPEPGSSAPDEYNNIVSFTIRSEVDTRNTYPFPRRGKHHLLQYETAGPWLGSETSYSIIYSFMENFIPAGRRFTLHPRIRWGTADITTPFGKQFRLGGQDSFLGLPENALIGRRLINLNLGWQTRLPVVFDTTPYVTVRYDLAGVWPSYSQISLSDFRHSLGIIIAAATPAGPIRFSCGWTGSRHAFFSFSAGHDF